MNFHDCCDWTAFLDIKKHHVIVVSVMKFTIIIKVMPLIYHFLSGPSMEPLLQHVAVTHANTLADQYRPSRLVRDLQNIFSNDA